MPMGLGRSRTSVTNCMIPTSGGAMKHAKIHTLGGEFSSNLGFHKKRAPRRAALFEREECRPHARSPEGRANVRTLAHWSEGGKGPPYPGEGRVEARMLDSGPRRSQGGNHDLVQPAEVRSCPAGDYGGREQHHLCGLECPRRDGAATPLLRPPGDQVPRSTGGEPCLRTAPGDRPDARRGRKVGAPG